MGLMNVLIISLLSLVGFYLAVSTWETFVNRTSLSFCAPFHLVWSLILQNTGGDRPDARFMMTGLPQLATIPSPKGSSVSLAAWAATASMSYRR